MYLSHPLYKQTRHHGLRVETTELLEYVIAFPVADIQKLTDGLGDKVLPDTFLLPKGTTAREFAGYIHKDLYDSFVCGIDARTSKKLSESYEVKDRDIIKIQSSK